MPLEDVFRFREPPRGGLDALRSRLDKAPAGVPWPILAACAAAGIAAVAILARPPQPPRLIDELRNAPSAAGLGLAGAAPVAVQPEGGMAREIGPGIWFVVAR